MTEESESLDVAKIFSITSIEELDGYEAEGRARGLRAHEMKAIAQMRKKITKWSAGK